MIHKKDIIYIFGGLNEFKGESLNTIYTINIKKKILSLLSIKLPQKLSNVSVTINKNIIFLCGGLVINDNKQINFNTCIYLMNLDSKSIYKYDTNISINNCSIIVDKNEYGLHVFGGTTKLNNNKSFNQQYLNILNSYNIYSLKLLTNSSKKIIQEEKKNENENENDINNIFGMTNCIINKKTFKL